LHHALDDRNRLFDAGQMSRVINQRKLRARNQACQLAAKLRRRRDIFRAAEHKRRLFDSRYRLTKIRVTQSTASADVAIRLCLA
jgi:hypothetical protein